MAKEIKWNKRFDIGVDSIDKAHRKLFQLYTNYPALMKMKITVPGHVLKELSILKIMP